ncbi:MAG: DNA mismatch repair protein MutS [Deltaproteobacteria bacterium]|nr:DNA mismatch repair protein MutS [Deltaproteobacteria bacterium]
MNDATTRTPSDEYRARLADRRARVVALEQRSARIANLRLAGFAAILLVAWLAFGARAVRPLWIAAPFIGFVALVVWHDRELKRQRRAARAVTFYERGLARIEDRWHGVGESGERFADPSHPYAADLDLFGPASLFQLLCTARTAAGEETLASWLREPAQASEVRARQAAVTALRDRLDLREDVAVLGADVRAELDPRSLEAWGSTTVQPIPGWTRPVAAIVAAIAVAATVGWLGFGQPIWIMLLAVFAERALLQILRARLKSAVEAVERAGADLEILAEVLGRVEREELSGPLQRIRDAIFTGSEGPSKAIAELRSLVGLYEARFNQFFIPFNTLLLWEVQVGVSIARWRARFGPRLGGWIRTLGELEALSALAAYAYEHPADVFPELHDSGATYDGEQLGHPLIPAATCVRNDLKLVDGRRLLLVSGSNMSGKSTFLRTVGVNAVLALAGAPVRAKRMALSPMRLGATLRIQDSLQQGASRFYAEITRLRQILDLAKGDRPLLFLLDEILHGTNSHDRLIGAEAVIRALLDRGALGLVTTHDLALANVVGTLGNLAANAHFADTVQDGKLVFDYREREGVVQGSNAIALMRAVGLPV